MLYNFQRDAALAIINKLEKYNGCILADSVGLGKTFTALAVIKYYENLVLISRRKNTAQGNLDYQKKKDRYFKKNVEVFPNSIRVYQNYQTWTLDDLKHNHEEVITALLKAY